MDDNVRPLTAAVPIQENRRKMIQMLSEVIAQVANGEALGLVLTIYNGQRQYTIRWCGEYDPMQLVGAIEATKLQVLPPMLAARPTEG